MYSIQTAISDGTMTSLPLSIEYPRRDYIHVYFDGEEKSEGDGWNWVGTTDKAISFPSPVPSGVEVRVQRITPLDTVPNIFGSAEPPYVGYAEFDADTIDQNFRQTLQVAQESVDRTDEAKDAAQDAIDASILAQSVAAGAVTTANNAVLTADAAALTANDAHDIATGIDAKATQALEDSSDAVDTANNALGVAQGIDAKATQALADSADAVDTANNALGIAQGIDAKAQQALEDSADAVNTANGIAGTANTALDTANNAELIASDAAAGTSALMQVGSTYRDKDDLKDLGVNGTLLEGGGFPRSMSDELSDNYSGNNPDLLLVNQAPVDLAQCSFVPPNEISSNFVHSNFPWMNIGGAMRRLMAVDIRTNLFNSPVNIPLFKPTRTNGSGILTFRYIGDKPIHTVIQGHLLFLLRTGATSADPFARVILRLESSGHPHLEQGQNSGARALGTSLGGHRESFHLENYAEFQDLCFPIDQGALDNVASQPNLYVGSDNGFFANNYAPDTDELATVDGEGPVGPEVRTTKWMDVESYVQSRRRFLMNFTGTSTRSRVQYKDAAGNIRIYTNMNAAGSSRRIYRLPPDAKYARIYYSGRGDTVDESSIEFKPLGALTSTDYDPLAGLWTERHIAVHRDIVLWPGVEYWFNLFTTAYEGASARSWGFRVQSGGLSFLFDSGGVRKSIASTFWEK